jgi:hypothetical protein
MKIIIALIIALAVVAPSATTEAGQFCGPVCVRKVPTGGGGYRCLRWKQVCGRSYP